MKNSPRKRRSSRKKKRQNSTASLAVILCLLIGIGAVSYIYRDKIGKGEIPNRTESYETAEQTDTPENKPQETPSDNDTHDPLPHEEPSVTVVKTEEEPPKPDSSSIESETPSQKPPVKSNPAAAEKPESKSSLPAPKPVQPIAPQIKTEEKQLFFVRYSESTESIEIVPVIRRISYETSPLTQTLNTLLYGPNVTELSRNLVTMIPDKTKILSIKIDKGIAYINFNESFMFNANGREGTEAQLAQIVYTATQFPTVSAVQFLIEGEKKSYLTDGSYIERPLSRNSF